MEIRMARGDIKTKTFTIRRKDKSVYQDTPDEIYFTVKKYHTDHEFLFQKRLSDGKIASIEAGKYQFTIQPEDTNNLDFGEYEFDIEIVKAPNIKETFCGILNLDKEVTHANNEG